MRAAQAISHARVWGSPVKKLFGGHPAPVNVLAHSQTGVELFVWCSPFWGDRGLASECGNDLVKGCGHGGHRKDRQLCEEMASWKKEGLSWAWQVVSHFVKCLHFG